MLQFSQSSLIIYIFFILYYFKTNQKLICFSFFHQKNNDKNLYLFLHFKVATFGTNISHNAVCTILPTHFLTFDEQQPQQRVHLHLMQNANAKLEVLFACVMFECMMFPWTFDTIQKLTRYSLCAKINYVPKISPLIPTVVTP